MTEENKPKYLEDLARYSYANVAGKLYQNESDRPFARGALEKLVESFNVDIESQSVLEYVIKPSNLIAELINNELIVSRGQVVEITQDKIIVNDNIVTTGPFKKFSKIFNKEKSVVLNNE